VLVRQKVQQWAPVFDGGSITLVEKRYAEFPGQQLAVGYRIFSQHGGLRHKFATQCLAKIEPEFHFLVAMGHMFQVMAQKIGIRVIKLQKHVHDAFLESQSSAQLKEHAFESDES